MASRDLRRHQPGDRAGHRRGGRRLAGGHAPRDRRGPPRLRRDVVVDRPRVPQGVPRPAPGGARGRAGGASRGADRRGRLPPDGHPRSAARPPARRRAPAPDRAHRHVPLGAGPRRHDGVAHRDHDEPQGVARAGRRRRRDRAVELPVRGHDQQARPGPRHRQHRRAEGRSRHAVQRNPHRPPRRRAHRHPARRAQRDHRVGPPRRRGAHPVAEGRPDLLHRLDRGREADHGEGRGDDEAPLPRARRQVRRHRPRRRRPRRRLDARVRRLLPRRAGLRDPDADAAAPLPLRRGRRDGEGHLRHRRARRPAGGRHPLRAGHLGQAARPHRRLHPQRASTRARTSSSAARTLRQDSTPATTSRRRCSSTSTTR